MFISLRRSVIGAEEVVIEASGRPYGLIMVNGQKWHAATADGTLLEKGDKIVVTKLQGLQLAIVSRSSEPR